MSMDDCKCLEPCSRISSDMALSSVALSSLSVDGLLKSDVEDLRRKYHNALELKYVRFGIFARTLKASPSYLKHMLRASYGCQFFHSMP